MKKVLFAATVMIHIQSFHIPYLKWFKDRGFEVHVACNMSMSKGDGEEIPYCDFIHDIPFARSPLAAENIKAYRSLKAIINKEGFSVIHAHTPVGGALARLAARKARKRGTKVIYTAHGFHFYKGSPLSGKVIFYPIEKSLARYTDCLITINDEDYNTALSRHFKARNIVKVNGVGIDLNKFTASKDKRAEKRAELGIGQDDIMLLSVGELNNNKNHMTVVKAVAAMKNTQIKYVICGSGALKKQIEAQARSLGIESQVMLAGYRNDTREIYQAADIFVFPSLREGLPVSVMEAMASGIPIVAADIRGNRDLIIDGKGGYLIENALDDREYASKITDLINNPEKIKEMTAFNLDRVLIFSIDNVKKQMTDIYEEYI